MADFSDRHLCLFRAAASSCPRARASAGGDAPARARGLARAPAAPRPGPNPVSIGRAQLRGCGRALPRRAQDGRHAVWRFGRRRGRAARAHDQPRARRQVEIWAARPSPSRALLTSSMWGRPRTRGCACSTSSSTWYCAAPRGGAYRDRLCRSTGTSSRTCRRGSRRAPTASAEQLEQLIIGEDKVFAVNNAHGLHIQRRFVSSPTCRAVGVARQVDHHSGLVFLAFAADRRHRPRHVQVQGGQDRRQVRGPRRPVDAVAAAAALEGVRVRRRCS